MKDIINGSYSLHERNTFDFFFAKSLTPTPLVVYIHGGGFTHNDKSEFPPTDKEKCLNNGVSYATINYPYVSDKPLYDILVDIANAIVYFKDNATQLNINPKTIGCYGHSAGAGASLFLAGVDAISPHEAAKYRLPKNASIFVAGLYNTQSTYDFYKWKELFDIPTEEVISFSQKFSEDTKYPMDAMYNTPIHCVEDFFTQQTLSHRSFLDLTNHITSKTSPIYINCTTKATDLSDTLHSQVYSNSVYETCLKHGVTTELHTPENNGNNDDFISFFLRQLF